MGKKRNSLEDLFSEVAKPKSTSEQKAKPAKRKPAASKSAKAPTGRRPNLKQPALYLKIPVHRQLRMLAFEEDKKMHDLFLEAIDMLLADRGLPGIAELERDPSE